jgi:hypothetical protein
MFLFSTAKRNMLVHFKARFYREPNGEDYLFYPKENEQGYTCSESDYLTFSADFQKFLKGMSRIMWSWFLLGMPILIGLAIWQNIELNTVVKAIIVMLPFPFVAYKGWKLYNAPNILVQGKRPTGRPKTKEEISETKFRRISWFMPIVLIVISILGSYKVSNDTTFKDWELSLTISLFMVTFFIGCYILTRKWTIYAKDKKRR